MNPWPGSKGTAAYCGYGAHTYRMALEAGAPGEQCLHCGHIRGQRKRPKK